MRGKFNWSQTKRHKPSKPEYIFSEVAYLSGSCKFAFGVDFFVSEATNGTFVFWLFTGFQFTGCRKMKQCSSKLIMEITY